MILFNFFFKHQRMLVPCIELTEMLGNIMKRVWFIGSNTERQYEQYRQIDDGPIGCTGLCMCVLPLLTHCIYMYIVGVWLLSLSFHKAISESWSSSARVGISVLRHGSYYRASRVEVMIAHTPSK